MVNLKEDILICILLLCSERNIVHADLRIHAANHLADDPREAKFALRFHQSADLFHTDQHVLGVLPLMPCLCFS